ncbi:BZ3500_MvSof-1268-A1-R1_Chr9g10895 [Microbotryum saponariae]|uniref:Iron-sulfur assembly protein 1 n=1 Tax=Microbotryum saponariae TaxID=289078 RepID=A0A2X0N7R3_9BASI|nr:BZ3501_MvSof-1269-A2-R1_Chr9g10643 [Microbotryum saponariae]SDA00877.1 BZ3500_MvSof-1268-A1-R1_Chr9g10895 [Microbotryum saponariae]
MNTLRTSLARSLNRSYPASPLAPSSICIVSSSNALFSLSCSSPWHTPSRPTSPTRSATGTTSLRWIRSASSASSVASSLSGTAAVPGAPPIVVAPTAASTADKTQPTTKRRAVPKARKAAITLQTPAAVTRIRSLLSSPTPTLIRIGVRNKGCAGMSYHLEYVDEPARFDEVVEQDGVKVVVDSRALFSVIGSEMDWQEDALQAKFVFKNPNIKDACGCGESFIV